MLQRETRRNLGAVARPKRGEPRFPDIPAGSGVGMGPAGVGKRRGRRREAFPPHPRQQNEPFFAHLEAEAKTAGFAVQFVWESVTN